MSFNELGLSAELLNSIREQGYNASTPIQQQAIPAILKGEDIMASSQTGTGKTAGFTLPLLQRLSGESPSRKRKKVRALILSPTRELAAQINDKVYSYGKYLPLKSAAVFGGVKINPQILRLRRGVDVLVATPGRLLDLVNQRAVDLRSVEILVLDEADQMLDMGFIPDIRKILNLMPKDRQNLLFSATFSKEIKALAKKLLKSPVSIGQEKSNRTAEQVDQRFYPVERSRKRELLSYLICSKNWKQVLVFTRTKHGADRLVMQLKKDGLLAVAIHGNKSQGARTRALTDFKQRKVRILVATDIAARGLDISRLPYVVNFDLPIVPTDYVHRIGRTGRANESGLAVSLVCPEECKSLLGIEKLLGRQLEEEVVPGFELSEPLRSARAKGKKKAATKSRNGRRRQRSKSASRRPRRR